MRDVPQASPTTNHDEKLKTTAAHDIITHKYNTHNTHTSKTEFAEVVRVYLERDRTDNATLPNSVNSAHAYRFDGIRSSAQKEEADVEEHGSSQTEEALGDHGTSQAEITTATNSPHSPHAYLVDGVLSAEEKVKAKDGKPGASQNEQQLGKTRQ